MHELNLRKQPVNILAQRIRDYAHRHPEVEKLMILISNMVVTVQGMCIILYVRSMMQVSCSRECVSFFPP